MRSFFETMLGAFTVFAATYVILSFVTGIPFHFLTPYFEIVSIAVFTGALLALQDITLQLRELEPHDERLKVRKKISAVFILSKYTDTLLYSHIFDTVYDVELLSTFVSIFSRDSEKRWRIRKISSASKKILLFDSYRRVIVVFILSKELDNKEREMIQTFADYLSLQITDSVAESGFLYRENVDMITASFYEILGFRKKYDTQENY